MQEGADLRHRKRDHESPNSTFVPRLSSERLESHRGQSLSQRCFREDERAQGGEQEWQQASIFALQLHNAIILISVSIFINLFFNHVYFFLTHVSTFQGMEGMCSTFSSVPSNICQGVEIMKQIKQAFVCMIMRQQLYSKLV